MPEVPELVTLASADMTVVIDPGLGARAVSWRVDGVELLASRSTNPVEHGMYPMAPWAGRLRGNAVMADGHRVDLPITYEPWALHGTVVARAASSVAVDEMATGVVATFDSHPEWPWPMSVGIGWRIDGRVLEADIVVTALESAFPAVVGWHPWFRRRLDRGGPAEWTLAATRRLQRGDDHLPTGDAVAYRPEDGPFDDAFHVPDGRARIAWPGALTIDVASDGDWYVVFDELAEMLCLEPQSGPPDGLTAVGRPPAYGPLRMAEPGTPLTLTTRWTVTE